MHWHETNVTVRFNEADQWGMVWYANYFAYVEVARTEVLESVDLLPNQIVDLGFIAPIIHLECDYKAPARYNQKLTVRLTLQPQDVARLVFAFEIVDAEDRTCMVRGSTHQVLLKNNGTMVYKLKGELEKRIHRLARYFEVGTMH